MNSNNVTVNPLMVFRIIGSRVLHAVSPSLGLAACITLGLGLPLDAATFGSNSATINNTYFLMKVGTKLTYSGTGVNEGETGVATVTAVETVDGVSCLKSEGINPWGWSNEWFAQDTSGAVWRLREEGGEYTDLPDWVDDGPDEEDYLIMPAAPQVGEFYHLWVLDYQVISKTAEVKVLSKKYTGCLHLQCVDDAWPDEQEFYAPGVGEVYFFDSEGGWQLKSASGLPAVGSGGSGGAGTGGSDDEGGTAKLGTYDGYFYGEGEFNGDSATAVRGTLALKLSSVGGKLTAKVTLQKSALSFGATGWTSVAEDGTCLATLTAKSGETLDLSVSANRVWGTLSGGSLGGDSFTLDGARNRFADKTDAEAQSLLSGFLGYFTVALPVADALSLGEAEAAPQGSGYLTVTIGSGGSAKIAGVLADGTKLSQASRLILADGQGPGACVPFFLPLYGKAGWSGGLLRLCPETRTVYTDRDLGWFVRWEKPGAGADGFSLLLDADGGFYGSGAALASAYLFTADAGSVPYYYADESADAVSEALPEGLAVANAGGKLTMAKGVKPVPVEGEYDYSGENSSLATLAFTSGTGLFKGKFNLYYDYDLNGKLTHKTVSVPYAGVLTPVRDAAFEGGPAGQGHCLIPDNDPALKAYKLKRSHPVQLDAVE